MRWLAVLLATLTPALAGVRVVDGDTINLDGMPIRILEIDTPEVTRARCANEVLLGLAAKERLQKLLADTKMTYTATGYDRFGRVLAHVYADGVNVADVLLREGYALRYTPGQAAKAQRLATWCGPIKQEH